MKFVILGFVFEASTNQGYELYCQSVFCEFNFKNLELSYTNLGMRSGGGKNSKQTIGN